MSNLLGDYLTSRFMQMPRLNVCHTPEVHVSFCIRWYWPQKCGVVSLPGIFWHSNFTLCSVQVYTWREFVSPNFHWLFMVMRYLFWCYDDGVLNALTILFVLVLSTLLVIMLTNFSFILLKPTQDVGYLKNVTRGWLTADISRYIVLNKIGRVLNHFQFTLS